MLKRILILLVLALTKWGCDVNHGENLNPLMPGNLDEVRSGLEREKREFLKIEDLQVGDGAIASWGRCSDPNGSSSMKLAFTKKR